ncbi:MAG TPA: ATP-binding SpoIIE family protein phosphatase [Candidatus Baltobacteraceae bacterium]|nr:ATP-binding SpoIIE family protein phosphatase [Candidatus Baltobacteraceae bacterium]
MDALSRPPIDGEWIRVEEASAPGYARRSAARLSERLGFSETRVGEVAIAATELATNLQRHAKQGVLLIRPLRNGGEAAIELLALDSGPGIADLGELFSDGYSTRGTLGIGLGAVKRFATSLDAHSVPGRGTAIVATFWNSRTPGANPAVAALTRPMDGETVCGDAWAAREPGTSTTLMLADGLGHGELAAMAAREAVRAFQDRADVDDVVALLEHIGAALRPTRGAAVGIVKIERDIERVTFAGIGNIAAWIDDGEQRRGLISAPGIAGAPIKRIRAIEAAFPKHSVLVMHSDGLSTKWDLNQYPGLRTRDRRLIAATLFRDAGIHHDDASILVA